MKQKHPITPALQQYLSHELKDKTFLHKSLTKLLNKPSYYTLQQHNLTIHFIPTRKLTLKKMQTILQRLTHTATHFNITSPYIYWVIPCSLKRKFPKTTSTPISQEHINGGYTYVNGNTIFIYREEECPKVMLHELLHHSPVDTQIPDDPHFYDTFKIHRATQLRINEAIVEFWALILHLSHIAQEYHLPLTKLIQDELDWSLQQCKQLAHYQQPEQPWYEETHAYSYVRLKTCILFFYDRFRKMKYPYQPNEILQFFIQYNNHPKFQKAIQAAPSPTTNSFRLTVYGDW